MIHPFKMKQLASLLGRALSNEQISKVSGAGIPKNKPEFYTTLAHGEEGGLPEDPVM